ncbi:hypothetical protein LGH74_22675 [Hymenobacter sp. BT178]|uniref:Uncharacterized protein n=1 Tax=Hymenobacter lucidus TaxID=2880930 RepID=A0ABS8AYB6_9BACT|nr:hypothetical protein [Hymenobacter lucidus]
MPNPTTFLPNPGEEGSRVPTFFVNPVTFFANPRQEGWKVYEEGQNLGEEGRNPGKEDGNPRREGGRHWRGLAAIIFMPLYSAYAVDILHLIALFDPDGE